MIGARGTPKGKRLRGGEAPALTFLITGLYRGGGAETQLVRVARHMASIGWRVHVVSVMPILEYGSQLHAAGVDVTSLEVHRGRYDPRAFTRLVSLLRRQRPDVLCTFMFHANVLGRVAGRVARIPRIVSSIRNTNFGGAWADRLMRWTDRLSDLTTTNSTIAAEALMQRDVVRPDAMRVVPNGLDVAQIDATRIDRGAYLAELGVPPGRFVWLSVGRLEPQKGHDTTLHALARLRDRGVDAHLLLVGEGGERERLLSERSRLGIRDHVRFLGLREDVPELLKVSDGLVLASRWEGLPNVLIEAAACRTPIVATRVGGVEEIVENEVSGVLVAPDDPTALAHAMERVYRMTGTERRAMTGRGYQHVKDRFALEPVMKMWSALFHELADGKARS